MLEGPIASTATSRPFRSAHVRESILYVDLDQLGYTEEEFLLRGTADARDPDGNVIAAGEPYVTRVLVRRPADAGRFSGTVHLEPFHVLNEDTPAWSNSYRYFTGEGDAWIGVTVVSGSDGPARFSMSGGLSKLKEFDPDRYAGLPTRPALAALSTSSPSMCSTRTRRRGRTATDTSPAAVMRGSA